MKLHQRMLIVQKAGVEIGQAILSAEDKWDLSFGEIVSILGGILASHAKYVIREERHGDASIPGDRA